MAAGRLSFGIWQPEWRRSVPSALPAMRVCVCGFATVVIRAGFRSGGGRCLAAAWGSGGCWAVPPWRAGESK
jgi:hypothetical protein